MLVFEKGCKTTIKPKSRATDLEKYFFNILDDYDKDRVYPGDIKKIIRWYNILVDKGKIKLVKSKIDLKPDQREDKSTSKEFHK